MSLIHKIIQEASNKGQGVKHVDPGHHVQQLRERKGRRGKGIVWQNRKCFKTVTKRMYLYVPALVFVQLWGAGSGSPGCMHTAHRTGHKLHDRLQKRGGNRW